MQVYITVYGELHFFFVEQERPRGNHGREGKKKRRTDSRYTKVADNLFKFFRCESINIHRSMFDINALL